MKLDIVEEGKLVEYERFGECLQCGECCRKKITFEWDVAKPRSDDDEGPSDWSKYEGWSLIYAHGIYWYILVASIEDPEPDDERNPCNELEGNLCSVHGDQFKIPPLCSLWPVHPKDLLPGCGFRIERCQS